MTIVISGTGRAGTSFLVAWLDAAGLDAGLDDLAWHDDARAGYERRLDSGPLPVVVKDPWLWTYCDTLDLDTVHIEVLVVPVRDLAAAAGSRIRQERAALTSAEVAAGVYGRTKGGAISTLDEHAQQHTLAVGFHQLIQWAVANEIPLVLLDFPRIITDVAYLLKKMAAFLPDPPAAFAAHRRLADPALVGAAS